MRCVYTQPYPVLLAMLFGVEVSYFGAWSALPRSGPYTEFVERWSSAGSAGYVAARGALAYQDRREAAQEHFREVLAKERDSSEMSCEAWTLQGVLSRSNRQLAQSCPASHTSLGETVAA